MQIQLNVLTDACICAADGNEGGRHQLVTAAVSNGTLYICKVRAVWLYPKHIIMYASSRAKVWGRPC